MARYYDTLLEFGEQGNGPKPDDAPDALEASSYAIMAVWRHRFPVTFSRAKGESFSKSPADAIRLREKALVIVEDVQSMSVSHSKTNHVSQMSATLLPGANYLTEMFPGDWVAVWMVNSAAKARSLLERIQSGKACNGFSDGLKFLGRLASVRKRITQGSSGMRAAVYSVNAAGFTELDASLYYDPHLASISVGAATDWLRKTGIDINNLIVKGGGDANSGGGISINKILPLFLDAFYGQGVPKNEGFQGSLDTNAGLNNPNAFIVPDEVAAVLGVTSGTKPSGKKSWNDICTTMWGIQKYQLSATTDFRQDDAQLVSDSKAGSIFTPDGVPTETGKRRLKCPDDLLGTFLPSPPQFNGQRTVWAILQQFLNPVVNEMFACLRAGPNGDVFPTLVVRQLPFSSGLVDETYRPKEVKAANEQRDRQKGKDQRHEAQRVPESRQLKLTRFGELPRWLIHPILIKSVDLGRSDSLRFNFIHVEGETGLQTQNRPGGIVRDPPVTDDLDIIRSGLRPYLQVVNCAPADTHNRKAGDWMYILSDILMGQHLTLTGTMECQGLASPVAPGDNIEYDGHVLHIEAVSHNFVSQPNGMRIFSTSFALSHGLKADQLEGGDFSMYSGTAPDDLRGQEPAISRDYWVNPEEPSTPPSPGESDSFPQQDMGSFDIIKGGGNA